MLHELIRHLIERPRELPDFTAAPDIHSRAPVPFGHFVRALGQFSYRARDARRCPPAHKQSNEQAEGHDAERQPQYVPLERHYVALRTSNKEHTEQVTLTPLKWQRVKNLRACGVGGPINFRGFLSRLAALFFHQRREALRVYRLVGGLDKVGALEARIQIEIEQRAHPRRKDQRCQEFLAQPLAADNIDRFVGNGHLRHGHQSERRPLGRIHFQQERADRRPIRGSRDPIQLVTEPRRPFR